MTEFMPPQFVPKDHSRQVEPWYFVEALLSRSPEFPLTAVLDLGCGEGLSADRFARLRPGIKWVGLDIPDSPEAKQRKQSDLEVHYYDGQKMPFADASFDLVFCRQVFEHVRYPREVMAEIHRVLRPGGHLIGSVSQLEPYHSFSVCNYTTYGFYLLLEDAGLKLQELRPGPDSLTWIFRRLLGRPRFFERWLRRESPLNLLFELAGKLLRKTPQGVNTYKLLFAYSFGFLARKPGEPTG